jgi:hypothetical protein
MRVCSRVLLSIYIGCVWALCAYLWFVRLIHDHIVGSGGGENVPRLKGSFYCYPVVILTIQSFDLSCCVLVGMVWWVSPGDCIIVCSRAPYIIWVAG